MSPHAPSEPHVHGLRVSLQGITPEIWRKIWVPGTVSLWRLHRMIQAAMGWSELHRHLFEIKGKRYGARDPGDPGIVDDHKVTLAVAAPKEKTKFQYIYNLGNPWRLDVVVVRVEPVRSGALLPACSSGARACPPDDIGGPQKYPAFLAAIRDPNHAKHEEMLELAGGRFDPEAFDTERVTTALRDVE
jgi:hypothetical protein